MPEIIDLTGKVFGRLKVLGISHKTPGRKYMWDCVCKCGNPVKVMGCKLKSGHTSSCGCLHKEELSILRKTHGMSETRIYKIWCMMVGRGRHGNKYYKDISVDEQWYSFENFYKDMGDPPTDKHEIDRIDNTKNYCKDNCRWATRTEQMNNTRRSTKIIINGKKYTIAELARIANKTYGCMQSRVDRGWPIEEIIADFKDKL